MEPIYDYAVKLIKYVLTGDIPGLPEQIDFEKLFAFGKSHGVENMLYVGLRDLKIDVPVDNMKMFQTAYEMQIMVEATQALELDALTEEFEEQGIDNIPLKGSVIKYLYPTPDLRKSGDIDILIHPEDINTTNKILLEYGYVLEEGTEHHEVHVSFIKKPFMKIEVHKRLVRHNSRANKFCESVWDNAITEEGKKHLYRMNNEFLYTHLITHLAKHLFLGGAGIRLITDIFLVREKLILDNVKLDQYLKSANLIEINNMILQLIKKWFFDDYIFDQDIDLLEQIVLKGGSFGSLEMRNTMFASSSLNSKLIKYFLMIFPGKSNLVGKYPILKSKPYMLPVIWLHRFFSLIIFGRGRIAKETIRNFNNSNADNDIKKIVKAVKDKQIY